jgi:hypothetical protein
MKIINLRNDRLQTLLLSTIDLFYNDIVRNMTEKFPERKDSLISNHSPFSDEYLFEAFKLKLSDFGFPRALRGMGLTDMENLYPNDKNTMTLRSSISRISRFLGSPNNALSMYYPDNGYIGWHHNGNAPGYNILMTYSLDGDGGFSFWDYKTKSIQTIQDKVGWSVKVGYYPNIRKEPDRVYWHMAKTKKERISIAWVLDQKEMWKSMIDEISQGDYDHDDILGQ